MTACARSAGALVQDAPPLRCRLKFSRRLPAFNYQILSGPREALA